MGLTTLTLALLVCGARGVVVREWYVPFYGPHTPYNHYYSYSQPLLPHTYGNQVSPFGGFALPNNVQYGAAPLGMAQTQFAAPQVGAGAVGGTPLGNGALQSGYVTATNEFVQSSGNGQAQAGGGAGTGQNGTGDQSWNMLNQSSSGAAQSGNGANGNGVGQTGGSPTGGEQSDMWAGYAMYQAESYPELLGKVTTALQANGPELTATQINFAGSKTVGPEAQSGPGTVSLINFGTNLNKDCYAYLVEPTGKTPEIPKESITCTT